MTRASQSVETTASDRVAIREVVENWALWRDSGDFDRLATCWHADGQMVSTWQQSDASAFVAASRQSWQRGVDVVHLLGGCSIDVSGNRAIAQTKMVIQQRAVLHQTLVDVTCTGRFYDLFEQREGRWAIVLRHPIYERDRIDSVDGGTVPDLDADLLAMFPAGYRYLGYLQTRAGLDVARDLPGLRGPAIDALYARGRAWLYEVSDAQRASPRATPHPV